MQPKEVLREVARVLRPGGRVLISQSNRCFPTKVSDLWRHTSDVEHGVIIAAFLHACGNDGTALFEAISAANLPATEGNDPLFVIAATRSRVSWK
jgi:SAM-dependent methyltransferase